MIADQLAITVDPVFSGDIENGTLTIISDSLAFAFQIYCDFSGYTDIARGISKLLGFELMLNFKLPYFAKVPLALGFWWSRKPALPSDIGESVELTAFRYLPLYQSKALVRNPGRLLIAPNQIESDGFIPVEDAQPSAVKKDLKGHRGIYRAQSFVPSKVNQQAIDRLVELTREHRINIFVANSPIFEGMKSDPDFQAYSWGFKNYW